MNGTRRATLACTGAAVAALALPSLASAHASKTPPVATDFHARITHPVLGIEARVVDGDQTLWLDAGAHTVAIDGIQGEPLLRFDRAGEPLAKGLDRPATLGRWTIPLVVDGHREVLAGSLAYQPPPSAMTWIAIAVLLIAAGAYVARRSRRATILLAVTAVPIVWALRIARELYGRPTVGAVGLFELALTSVVGVVLLYGLLRPDHGVRISVSFLTAFGALYQAFTVYTVLARADALTVLPTTVVRIAVVASFVLGFATLAGSLHALVDAGPAASDDEPQALHEQDAAPTPVG